MNKQGYYLGYFDGFIPCWFKDDNQGGVNIVGKNWFYDFLILLWLPIAGLNQKGFKIKVKDN